MNMEVNEKEFEDSFYCNMEFGMVGMCGVLGVGINCMNIYIICKVFLGLV